MNQQELLLSISKYFARFREQVKILNKNGEFSINIHAENILIKILNIVYNCNLENVNYVEGKNYEAVDLRDRNNKISIQVTATTTMDKVKDTLQKYAANEYYKQFDVLKIFIITGRQQSYSQNTVDKITGCEFTFNTAEDVVDFSTLYVLINKQNDLDKILTINTLLESQFRDVLNEATVSRINNFKDLCQKLSPFFKENELIFKRFGPNSSASSVELLRWDLTLWYKARREKILPNNRIISNVIETYKCVIPFEYLNIFDEFLIHVYAFEKHCEDANFDYTQYQFPKSITDILYEQINKY